MFSVRKTHMIVQKPNLQQGGGDNKNSPQQKGGGKREEQKKRKEAEKNRSQSQMANLTNIQGREFSKHSREWILKKCQFQKIEGKNKSQKKSRKKRERREKKGGK